MIVGLGGQTPLKLAHIARAGGHPDPRHEPGVDRRWPRTASSSTRCATGSASRSPTGGIATTRRRRGRGRATRSATRCSCGRRTCSAAARWRSSTTTPTCGARWASSRTPARSAARAACRPSGPRSIDRFLEDAVEVDVDALRDRTGEVRHRRGDGAHRGGRRALGRLRVRDPAADALGRGASRTIDEHTRALADALDVVGLLNVQYAVKDGAVLRDRGEPAREPHGAVREQGDRRAARQGRGAGDGRRDARRAARRGPRCARRPRAATSSVKEAVLPFNRFPDVDTVLGPEMRSTGEVMGIDRIVRHGVREEPGRRGQHAARARAPSSSRSPTATRTTGLVAARRFAELGFAIAATAGTADDARARRASRSTRSSRRSASRSGSTRSISSRRARSTSWSTRPAGRGPRADGMHIRRAAIAHGVACVTTVAAALAAAAGIAEEVDAASPRCARCRSTTATASCGSRCEPVTVAGPCRAAGRRAPSTCGASSGPLDAPEPGRRRVGHVRSRRRGRARCATPRGLGAVTVKSVAAFAWAGNPPLRVTEAPGGGMLNSVGLPGPGRRRVDRRTTCPRSRRAARASSRRSGAARVDEYARGRDAARSAVADRLVAVEVNLSCPNVEDARGVFAHSPTTRPRAAMRAVVDAVGGAAPDVREALAERHRHRRRSRRAALDAGATGLTLVNTVMGLVDRRATRARRGSARAAAGSPVRRSSRSRCARCGRSRATFPGVPIIGTGGVAHRRGRGRDAARGRDRGRCRHRDVRRAARDRCGSSTRSRRWCAAHGVAPRRAT